MPRHTTTAAAPACARMTPSALVVPFHCMEFISQLLHVHAKIYLLLFLLFQLFLKRFLVVLTGSFKRVDLVDQAVTF